MIKDIGTINDNNEILLKAKEGMKAHEIVGFDTYQLTCPIKSPFKVQTLKYVSSGEKAYFRLIR